MTTTLMVIAAIIMTAQQLALWWTMRQWHESTKLNQGLLDLLKQIESREVQP